METPALVPDAVLARLAAEPGVRRVVLFGSRARGDAGPRADLGLAVDAPGLSDAAWTRLWLDVQDADTLLGGDLVRLDGAPPAAASTPTASPSTATMTDRERVRLENWGRAVARLGEALRVPADAPLALDASIQRFEFAVELAWKALKGALAAEGVQATTPREVLRAAYAAGWLDDEAIWLAMLRDRTLSSHTCDEALAAELYGRLPDAHAALARALAVVEQRTSEG